MKKFLPFLVFTFFSVQFRSQVTSISNGSWLNPATWNCACIPFTGNVTVAHTVTLNTSLSFTSGGINISSTGALIQDASMNRDIWINGGYFNNNGIANFRYFLVSAGTLTNTGSFTVAAMTNSVAFTNSGSIKMDSMWVAGNLTNATSGKIIGDSLTNATGVTLINNGRMMIGAQTNSGTVTNNNYIDGYAYTNAGTFVNNDSLMLLWSIWNKGNFSNTLNGNIKLSKTFYNYHPSKTAVFDNNGLVLAQDSWYNTDTVKGNSPGYFSVADSSVNSGFMKGSFVFCDLTPPPTTPKVDFNSGTISAGITYCVVGIEEKELSAMYVYPNPSNGIFYIKTEGISEMNVVISDLNGKKILDKNISAGEAVKFEQADGIYILKTTNIQTGAFGIRKLIIRN